MSSSVVREATGADVEAVYALEAACFPEDPWSRAMIAEELTRPGARFLVLEAEGEGGGFAIGLVVMEDLNVLQVAVSPQHRGGRLGERLMEGLHGAARHQEVSWLEVDARNEAALRLYLRIGYTPVARRKQYYADGGDAVVMRRGLGTGGPSRD